MTRELTGRHVLAITLTAFGLIIGVNLVMAFNAIASFPGTETASSYIASQHFQADRDAQQALGWQVDLDQDATGLRLRITDAAGLGVAPRSLEMVLRRPTYRDSDMPARLEPLGPGLWHAALAPAPGNWNADLRAEAADGTAFRQRIQLHVGGRQ